MTVKCLFCKDTKIEPGIPGPCVWCEDLAVIPKYEGVVAQLEAALLVKLDEWLASHVKVSGENAALQQRLTVAEQRYDILRSAAKRYLEFRHAGDCGQGYQFSGVHPKTEFKAALKPVEEDEQLGTRPVGCCCPPKGHSGIWAAAMCPVHFGLKRPGVSHEQ